MTDQTNGTGPVQIRTVPKPWGHETIWAATDGYVGKILHIKAGQALSVQYHNVKDETVYLLSGELVYRVQEGDARQGGEAARGLAMKDMKLKRGEAFRISPGTVHQMEAITDCDILEVSTNHLDDVVRLQDRYGREGTSAP
jgi:quercetin dioxygenase-like cupin family protein